MNQLARRARRGVVPVAPFDHRRKHRQQIASLGSDSALVADPAVAMRGLFQHPFRNEPAEPVRKHVARYSEPREVVVEPVWSEDTPAGTLRTAEHFQLSGGRITSAQLVFDATGWKAMLASQGATVDADGHATRSGRA